MKFLKISLCMISLLWIIGMHDVNGVEQKQWREFRTRLAGLAAVIASYTNVPPHKMSAVANLGYLDTNAADFQTKASQYLNEVINACKANSCVGHDKNKEIESASAAVFFNFQSDCGFDPRNISDDLFNSLFNVYMLIYPSPRGMHDAVEADTTKPQKLEFKKRLVDIILQLVVFSGVLLIFFFLYLFKIPGTS